MKLWRLEWLHEETGEWRVQFQNEDRAKFDEIVNDAVATANREGGWMAGIRWRIVELDMRQVGCVDYVPNKEQA